jgi:hypothetical protein
MVHWTRSVTSARIPCIAAGGTMAIAITAKIQPL